MQPNTCARFLPLLIALLGLTIATSAQTSNVQHRITQEIDEQNLVVLKGNTHPLANQQTDRGAAPADLPMNRMLLVLRHAPEQEAAIKDLIAEQQNQSSPRFHQWLTPQQFGEQFGPSDADVRIVMNWLASHGFQVANVSNSRHFVEFSGSAAQVEQAFHTEIHHFQWKSEDHWANASDPQIPAALASVVVGVKSLHNFFPKPMVHLTGQFRRQKSDGTIRKLSEGPEFTFPSGCSGPNCFFGLGPTDFATIYNVLPLWKAGIDGTGQSIAIVQDSNINVQDVRSFRALFGLPPNDPEIILDGPDPGLTANEDEAILDVSWSGAVAKGAKIKLVVSSGTNTTAGTDLSALFIVDNNIAPILSESFGVCELFAGTAQNEFFNALWQQAAAEGMTAFVSSGDGSSAGCDNFHTATMAKLGLAVNAIASTPYNVAVGGTDLFTIFNPTTFWSLTNAPTTEASALSYMPELPWNNSCANPLFSLAGFSVDAVANCNNANLSPFLDIGGGGGGVSSCTVSHGRDPSTCSGGYDKPSWQTGVGVPTDGKRDLPDVSLFSGNGFLGQFYIFCEADLSPSGACDLNPPFTDFTGAGGTSFAAPNFAGIMAMVDQKTNSRQGNANFVLYKLAAGENLANCNSTGASLPAANCIFNDVTAGSIVVPCAAGSPNCNTEGQNVPIGVLTGYNAGVGYDLATGLGTVNAANLVNNWSSITFTPTTTSLRLSPNFTVHGQRVNVHIDVDGKGGEPTGRVALKTDHADPAGDFPLDSRGGVDSTTKLLPGGFSFVTARYGGDPTFAHSDSEPEFVFVFPEQSSTAISLFSVNPKTFAPVPFSGGPYGTPVFLRADVDGRSGFGAPAGQLDFADNESLVPGDPFALNSKGNTLTPNSINTFPVGSHTIRAFYHGDQSFLPSVAHPVTFHITKAATETALSSSPTTAAKGASVTISAAITTASSGNPPAGTVTFFVGKTPLGAQVSVAGSVDPKTGLAMAAASIMTTQLPVGSDTVTAVYSGDHNYHGSTAPGLAITITAK